MNILSNMKYYLNYLNFNRGDNQIKEYFSSNEFNNAIKELTEEGYVQFLEKFNEICNSYSSLCPLNRQETNFIEGIKSRCISRIKIDINYKFWECSIQLAKNFISSFQQQRKNLKQEYQYEIIEHQNNILRKSIEQICPIAEVEITRRFSKQLLEELIIKNINLIDIENYGPDIQILNNYKASLALNYIYKPKVNNEKDVDNIQKNLEKLILDIKNKSNIKNSKKVEATKFPKIVYSDETNKEIKVIQTIFKIKSACYNVVHFNKKYQENLDINNYLFGGFLESEIRDSNNKNTIKLSKNIKNTNFYITDVAKFIAYGHSSYQILKKLENISKEFNKKIKFNKVKFDDLTKDNDINIYNEYKSEMMDVNDRITKELSKNVIKNCEFSLSKGEIFVLNNYLKNNILSVGNLNLNEIDSDKIKEEHINFFNRLINNMSIKERLKFNVTFEENMNLLNLKKETEILIPIFEKIEEINKDIIGLNAYYETELTKLKNELNNLNNTIKFINREDIFEDISKEDFIKTLELNFHKKEFDYSSPEINNFYLFIFLLKKNLYDEKSYKLAVGINEDFI